MKIHSMTATFGKLEHQTLTFQPGLNIIEAPNEWGKSTWCAFLVNMLYGIETRTRTTKDALADKERYAPWSGAPMSGRIDLNWNGRDITIQRTTKGRLIFGDFQAFETETGIEIPELTATNCGQQLLGVERSVFTRAGFLKLTDLPVTQDDSLRRRLNDLVTTGDESGDGDKLAETLKKLKNNCRYNRSGLLPQAENERDLLRNQLEDLHDLQKLSEDIRSRQASVEQQLHALENHQDALHYAASLDNAQRVEAAEAALEAARTAFAQQETDCASLLPRDALLEKQNKAQSLLQKLEAAQLRELPQPPTPPEIPGRYTQMTPESAISQAILDTAQEKELHDAIRKPNYVLFLLACLFPAIGVALLLANLIAGIAVIGLGAVMLGVAVAVHSKTKKHNLKTQEQIHQLHSRYEQLPPEQWLQDAKDFAKGQREYAAAMALYQNEANRLTANQQALQQEIAALAGDSSLENCQAQWAKDIAAWDALENSRRELSQAERHTEALRAMVKPVAPAKEPDSLTYDAEETQRLLNEGRFAQRKNQLELGQCQGKMENIGQESLLKARLDTLNGRIARLEDTYYALEMAQDALHAATTELQRRFAPRIAKRAQELFSKLTLNRYQQISLTSDFSLNALAEQEDTLRSSQWRSDGTVDQLYLALRLAVAEELTPEAPLILDDALVRFDDKRLKEALEILKEAAKTKQVILFTCQSREKNLL